MVHIQHRSSPGNRIKVTLGKNGSEFLYICDEDTDENKWQHRSWTAGKAKIPPGLIRNLKCLEKRNFFVTSVSFGPNREWFIQGQSWDGSATLTNCGKTKIMPIIQKLSTHGYFTNVTFGENDEYVVIKDGGLFCASNLPYDLHRRLVRITEMDKDIHCVRLFPNGGYFVSDSEGIQFDGILPSLCNALRKYRNNTIDVTVAGDGNWIVIASHTYSCSEGVSDDLCNKLDIFYSKYDRNKYLQSEKVPFKRYDMIEERNDQEERERGSKRQRTNHSIPRIRLPFDEYRCIERINMLKLRGIISDLKKQSSIRLDCIRNTKKYGCNQNNECLKKLERCRDLEVTACELYKFLASLSLDEKLGYVEYEVYYEHKDTCNCGRLFAKGPHVYVSDGKYPRTLTLQGMPSELRAPLVGEMAHEIDCENSQIRLICSLATQHKLENLIPTIIELRDNRQMWLEYIQILHGVQETEAKLFPQIILSGGSIGTWFKKVGIKYNYKLDGGEIEKMVESFTRRLRLEITVLAEKILTLPRFDWIFAEDQNRTVTKLMPLILNRYENEVLSIIHRTFYYHNWNVLALIFDGIIAEENPGACDSLEKVISEAELACRSMGWDIKLKEKPLHGLQNDEVQTIIDARVILRSHGYSTK